MKQILPENWIRWEKKYKNFLETSQIPSNDTLIGFTDDSGRITYGGKIPSIKNQLNKEFNQLDYLMPVIMNRKYISELQSIASVLPGAYESYLILHPGENDEDDIETIQELFSEMDIFDPVYGICILDSESSDMTHGTAFIAWKDYDDENHFAFYDPLSYRRKRTKDSKEYFVEYDYAKQVLTWIQEEGVQLNIHDLSEYCIKRSKDEYDCPQYTINAEYCHLYSLYFLFVWSFQGKLLTESGFKNAIESSYVVPMNKLTRAYTFESLVYRVILFSFIVTVLYKYFHIVKSKHIPSKNLIEMLKLISNQWYDKYNIHLIIDL